MKQYGKDNFAPFRKYITFFRDEDTIRNPKKGFLGVPEIMLHPLRMKNMEEIKTRMEDGKEFDYVTARMNKYNYFPFQVTSHLPLEPRDELSRLLNLLLKPTGYRDGQFTYHLTIDKRTYFYVLVEEASKETLRHCLPVQDKDKLSILRKYTSSLIFTMVNPDRHPMVIKFLNKESKKLVRTSN
jgi:hypothetical protein